MSIFEALVLGIIQGLTEFLPVSSSGHLLLAHEVFGSAENSLPFDVALHVGTLLALVVYFRRDIWQLLSNVTKQNTHGRLARLLIAATIPGVVAGLLFSDFIDETLRAPVWTALALAVVAVLMLIADKKLEGGVKEKDITTEQGMKVGFAQALALVPGVSRSGITITVGLFTGMTRVQAARFSFLLAMPIIAGSAFGILLKGFDAADIGSMPLMVGVVASFLSGLLAIRFFLKIVGTVGLKPFALYRLAVAAVVLATIYL